MIGAFLGWQGAVFAVFAGAAQGLIAYAISRVSGMTIGPSAAGEAGDQEEEAEAEQDEGSEDRHTPEPAYWGHLRVPFGPFLALGALEFLFFGEPVSDAWFTLVQRVMPI
jgi:leader peptidase (prepilin peptidase)/N-methyltransferase